MREFTRRQVCYRLGCSIATVQEFERTGKLHPRRDDKGKLFFSIQEVEKLAQTWKPRRTKQAPVDTLLANSNVRGKIAARAFRMFSDGKDLPDIVDALEADPIIIRQLYVEWKDSLAGRLEIEKKRRQAEREAVEQKRKDRADSLQAYRDHQKELAQIQAKATVEAAKEAAKIAARRTGT